MVRGALVLATLVLQSATAPPDTVQTVTVKYADGHVTTLPMRGGQVSWTSRFPRVSGADTSSDGLPLAALQFEEAMDGRDLVVTLALLYGTPHQRRVQVGRYRIAGDRPIEASELRDYGVAPVTMSLTTLPAPQLPIPAVTSPSSQLQVSVDPGLENGAHYQLKIANRATQAVMSVAFEGYRGTTKTLSGNPGGAGHTALIAPGAVYSMRLNASPDPAKPGGWLTLDRVDVTSVTWSDGVIEGSAAKALEKPVVEAGSMKQLDRILALLTTETAAEPPSISRLRAAVEALAIDVSGDEAAAVRASLSQREAFDASRVRSLMQIGMQSVKNALMNDIDAFARDPHAADSAACRAWLASTVTKFDGWRARAGAAPR
jgi:hypothetical protein